MKNTLGIQFPLIDVEKGIQFYEAVFGWKFDQKKYPGLAAYQLNDYTQVHIFKSDKTRPKGLNVMFGVQDLDFALQQVTANEGSIIKPKTEMDKTHFYAIIQDCFGNEITIYSE